MLSRFFILRPIFATVVSIIVITMGATALVKLPIAQYPDLAPPTIAVKANYPGADASVVADTVAAPIEADELPRLQASQHSVHARHPPRSSRGRAVGLRWRARRDRTGRPPQAKNSNFSLRNGALSTSERSDWEAHAGQE